MSKRSHMSRWEDLKHWFIDVGRHRYILHKFDMEPWREKVCYGCGGPFTEEPRYSFASNSMHWSNTKDCTDIGTQRWYAEHDDEGYWIGCINPLINHPDCKEMLKLVGESASETV